MTDYGHELEFGLFPSPDAASAQHVLELSVIARVSGLDLSVRAVAMAAADRCTRGA
jgi:hypothetical protein